MTAIVYTSRGTPSAPRWCVLRAAIPGGPITSLCLEAVDYGPALISTSIPAEYVCPACRTEIAAGTPGAASAAEPEPEPPAISRTTTPDLRGPRAAVDPVEAWDEYIEPEGAA